MIVGLKPSYPNFDEANYRKLLLSFVADLQILIKQEFVAKQVAQSGFRTDDISDDVDNALKTIKIYIEFKTADVIRKIRTIAESVNLFNEKSVLNSLKNIPATSKYIKGFSLKVKVELNIWAKENSRLIKTIPGQMLDKVASEVFTSYRKNEGSRILARRLESIFSISKNRAKLIARDQIAKLKVTIP